MVADPESIVQRLSGVADRASLARLSEWIRRFPRAAAFCDTNYDKVQRKLRLPRTVEERLDVVAEIEVASLLLTAEEVELRYEHGGADGPDFDATFSGAPFHVEVGRVRERESTERLDLWRGRFHDCVRGVPGSVWASERLQGLDLDVAFDEDRRDELEGYVRVFEEREAECLAWLRARLVELSRDLPLGTGVTEEPPCLRGFLEVEFLQSDSLGQIPHCCPGGGVSPIPWDGQEWRKFGGIVERKLRQMRPGTANVIAIVNDSTTHDSIEGPEAIARLRALHLSEPNDRARRAGFGTPAELEDHWARLSAVVVVPSKWRDTLGRMPGGPNFIWRNANAGVPLGGSTGAHLRSMVRPWEA